jgi:hypothetical protein
MAFHSVRNAEKSLGLPIRRWSCRDQVSLINIVVYSTKGRFVEREWYQKSVVVVVMEDFEDVWRCWRRFDVRVSSKQEQLLAHSWRWT